MTTLSSKKQVRGTSRQPWRRLAVLGLAASLASIAFAAELPQAFNHSFDVDAATVMACADGAVFTGEPTAASALNILFTGQVWDGTGTTLLATGDTHTFTAVGETYTFTVIGTFTVGSTILVQANNVPGTFPSTQGDAATATVADCSIAVPALPGAGLLLLGLALLTVGAALAGRAKWDSLARGGTAGIAAIVLSTLALGAAPPAWGSAVTLGFTKAFDPATMGPGSTSILTFTITNPNPHPESDLAFTDTLPAGVTISAAPQASTTCDPGVAVLSAPPGGTTISLSDGKVPASGSCTVRVNVTSSTLGTHMNVSSTLTSTAPPSAPAAADLTVVSTIPGFSKSFSPSTIEVGGRTTLTFVIDNNADSGAEPLIDFTDSLPAGMVIADPANVMTDCGDPVVPEITADPGTSLIDVFVFGSVFFPAVAGSDDCFVSVDATTSAAGTLQNRSSQLQLDDNDEAGYAAAPLVSTAAPLGLQKKFLGDPVPVGGTVTLEFRIDNRNRTETVTEIGFTDDLDFTPSTGITFDGGPFPDPPCGAGSTLTLAAGDVLTLADGTLAPGASCTFTVTLGVPVTETPGAHVNTTGAVTGMVAGDGIVGNTATDVLFVDTLPTFTKEFTDDPVGGGGTVTLEFFIKNNDPTSPLTDIDFTDDLETALAGLAANGLIAAGGLDPEPVDDVCGSGSELTIFDLNDDGGLTSPPFPNFPPDPTMLLLKDGSLAAAGMAGDSCTFSVVLDVPAAPGGTYTNTTEELTADLGGTAISRAPTSGDLIIVGAPRLTKDFTDDPVEPGAVVTLEFTLSHRPDAPGDAVDITFTDDLTSTGIAGLAAAMGELPKTDVCGPGNGMLTGSAGDTLLTFSGGTLMPGESCTFSLLVEVPAGAPGGIFTNTTSGVGATVDGVPSTSRTATADLIVAQVAFSKVFTDDPVIPGDSVTLEFELVNLSSSSVTDISFTDDLDPDLVDNMTVSMLPADGFCGAGSTMITFDPAGATVLALSMSGGSLAPAGTVGDSCVFSVVLEVPAATDDGIYPNLTSDLSLDVGGTPTTLPGAFDDLTVDSDLLFLTKEFLDDPVVPGGTVTLRFSIENLGAESASMIAFSDDLDAALSGLTATGLPVAGCGGTASTADGGMTIDFTGGSVGAGASCFFDVSVAVPMSGPGSFVNTTSIVSGTIGGLAVSGGPASDTLKVSSLLFTKAFDGPTTATGAPTLSFTITNLSTTASVSGLEFTDNLDATLSGLEATGLPTAPCGAGSTIAGTSFLTFSGGSLPPSGTCSIDVVLSVPAGAAPGSYPNTTSDLSIAGLTVADPATDDLMVEPPPTFAKVFAPDSIVAGLVSTLTFTIDNSASAVAATSLAFVDNLPTNLVVASPSNVTGDCGGTATAPSGGSSIDFSGGTVGAGASCTVSIDVTSAVPGMYTNTTGDLTSSSGNSGPASDTLTVIAPTPPTFAKDFAPNPIVEGEVSTLTFTIDNSASTVAAMSLAFLDNLPAGVEVASPSNVTGDCGGTLTAPSGGTSIDFSGGTVGAGASCTVSIDVTSAVAGMYTNTTGDLTSSSGNSGAASDTLTVNAAPPPTFTKVFSPNPVGDTFETTLTFTIDNSASALAANDLAFLDTLPFDLQIASVPMVANTCGGTVVAAPDTVSISLSGGSVAAGATCTISVKVFAPSVGSFENITEDLTSSLGNSGTATDTLTVGGCTAADGANLTLGSDIVLVPETYEVCNTIEVQEHFQVLGPNGALTLRAGVAVILFNGVSVEQNGELTIEIDPSLIP